MHYDIEIHRPTGPSGQIVVRLGGSVDDVDQLATLVEKAVQAGVGSGPSEAPPSATELAAATANQLTTPEPAAPAQSTAAAPTA